MKCATTFAFLAVAACGHDALFRSGDYATTQPFGNGVFHRITRNIGNDMTPTWLSDGTGVSYAFDESPTGAGTCVGLIAPEGGTRQTIPCLDHLATDSVANSVWPVVAADGRVAYVWENVPPFPDLPRPDTAIVFLDELNTPGARRAVFHLPYLIPGVALYRTLSHLGWLNRDTLVAVARSTTLVNDCPSCPLQLAALDLDVVLLDLTTTPATLTIVPGTNPASAVAPGSSGDDVYYTLDGDTRVFHRVLSTGDTSVVHDFGAAGIARDVRVAGNRLVAVVGGKVNYHVYLGPTPVQTDSGGFLHLLDLGTSLDSILPDSGVSYRHPTLSATGDRLVVEGWQTGPPDLWFFRLP
jgi:hypothetical protein